MRRRTWFMWKVFKESVWDFLWGKVVSLLGVLGTAQTVASLSNPDYVITIAGAKIDYRLWFVLTIVLAIVIILRILYTASRYKQTLEAREKIALAYDERIYPACRSTEVDNEEIIRVGVKVIGKAAVDNIEVFPKHLFHWTEAKAKHVRVDRIALRPMTPEMLSRPVNPGITPTSFVDLLKHKTGTREICLCYRGCSDKYICLTAKRYELEIEARGAGNQHGYRTLVLSFNTKNILTVGISKGD